MDGALERVHCVCAWYYEISDQLTGGDLMFDTLARKSVDYYDMTKIKSNDKLDEVEPVSLWKLCNYKVEKVQIKENDIVIWNQKTILHCVSTIHAKNIGKGHSQKCRTKLKSKNHHYRRGFLNVRKLDCQLLIFVVFASKFIFSNVIMIGRIIMQLHAHVICAHFHHKIFKMICYIALIIFYTYQNVYPIVLIFFDSNHMCHVI